MSVEQYSIYPESGNLSQDSEMFTTWNQFVILELPRGKIRLYRITPNAFLSTNLGNVPNANMVGIRMGSWYEIQIDMSLREMVVETSEFSRMNVTRDNRNLVDDGTAQKLVDSDIQILKERMSKGEICVSDVIQTIVDNSSSFSARNEYSQLKYLKRKQTKHCRTIRANKPTSHSLCGYFFNKSPEKIMNIRQDTLSQLLLLSGIRAYSDILVVDGTNGLISGSAIEKIGRYGTITVVSDLSKSLSIIDKFNFRSIDGSVLKTVSLSDIVSSDQKFDSLIIASLSKDPSEILKELEEYVKPSRSIVIYSPFREILIPPYVYCRASKTFVNIFLTESHIQNYKVLSGRFRPEAKISGSGGYLMSMIKVCS